MKSLGDHFRLKREEEGYDVEDVADATNITPRYIQAIEENDFSDFPADVYAKGFIRSYANFLGLDAESLVMEYSLNFESTGSFQSSSNLVGVLLSRVSLGVVILFSFFILWLRFAWLPANPDRALTATVKRPHAERAVADPPPEKDPSLESDKQLKLTVVASEKTWVYAIFDGMRKQEFMFQPGDQTTWTAEDTIRLRLGNAGGMKLYRNGEPLPTLGQSGEVADRIITLRDGELKIKPAGR